MAYCPQCGHQNADDACFCNKCGSSISTTAQPPYFFTPQPTWEPPVQELHQDSKPQKKAFRWGILLALVLLVVVTIGVLAADYIADDEINLFGLLGKRSDSLRDDKNDHGPADPEAVTTAPYVPSAVTSPVEPTPAETTPPMETAPAQTRPPETVPVATEPPETLPESSDAILLAVMEGQHRLRTESGSMMYLNEYLASQSASTVNHWQYLDFDQDGVDEVFAITDSEFASYLVIHWNGSNACCFALGFRSIIELKTNGYMSGSEGAAATSYYRVDFRGNSMIHYTLAYFNYDDADFQIDGKNVSEADANAFLREWYYIPNILGSSYYPPEEDPLLYMCDYCGVKTANLTDGLCEDCRWYVGRCTICGTLSANLFEGVCEVCEPYGGRDPEEALVQCTYCGTYVESWEVDDGTGLCSECIWYVGVCNSCGRLSADLFEGVCEICEPYGGRGEPEECAHCGQPSYDLVDKLCNDCYWYVGWCSVCGNLSYDIYEGVCADCEPNGGMDDPEEYMSQCTVCGEWSDTVFEGICDSCGGYDGRG